MILLPPDHLEHVLHCGDGHLAGDGSWQQSLLHLRPGLPSEGLHPPHCQRVDPGGSLSRSSSSPSLPPPSFSSPAPSSAFHLSPGSWS